VDPRGKIVDALLELAAERRFEEISIRDICVRSDVSLGEFRDLFASKGAVLGSLNRRFDRAVLDQKFEDTATDSPRDRLFDVLMRRLDAMAPYKAGMREVVAWIRRDPIAAARINTAVVNSMRFMLEAAGIESEGGAGALKIQGLVLAWSRVVNVWLDDDDAGLSKTMAALDSELTRGEGLVRGVEQLERLTSPFRALARGALEAGARFTERRTARPETRAARDF
jgi:AcrR family transcriptional regulator